jgi:hypothetical protein
MTKNAHSVLFQVVKTVTNLMCVVCVSSKETSTQNPSINNVNAKKLTFQIKRVSIVSHVHKKYPAV